jgi:hypothetical protein
MHEGFFVLPRLHRTTLQASIERHGVSAPFTSLKFSISSRTGSAGNHQIYGILGR